MHTAANHLEKEKLLLEQFLLSIISTELLILKSSCLTACSRRIKICSTLPPPQLAHVTHKYLSTAHAQQWVLIPSKWLRGTPCNICKLNSVQYQHSILVTWCLIKPIRWQCSRPHSFLLLRSAGPKYNLYIPLWYRLSIQYVVKMSHLYLILKGASYVSKYVCTLPFLQTCIKRLIMDGFWILRCL